MKRGLARYRRVLQMLAAVTLLILSASSDAAEIRDVKLGFGGVYKVGYWTPVSVQLTSIEGAGDVVVELTVPDSDGVQTRVSVPLGEKMLKQEQPTIHSYVKIGRTRGVLSVVVRRGDQVFAKSEMNLAGEELRPALASDAPLILTLGRLDHVEQGLSELSRAKSTPIHLTPALSVESLPDRWYGYEGVDSVILVAGHPLVAALASDHQRLMALDNWVRSGGHLIVSAGQGGKSVLEAGKPFAKYLPGQWKGRVPLASSEPLEIFCNTTDPLRAGVENGRSEDMQVLQLSSVRGDMLVTFDETSPADLPLVVRRSYGLGEVVFLAADLTDPEFQGWSGTGKLVTQLLQPSVVTKQNDLLSKSSSTTGYRDLSGQLRAALEQFDEQGIHVVSFWVVAVLAFVYIVLIAPGDYWLLRKMGGRMERTWITLPLVVIMACVGAWQLARWSKGDARRLNQVDLVDIDVASGAVRGTSWFTLFSPDTTAYDLSLQVKLPQGQDLSGKDQTVDSSIESIDLSTLLSWQGLPGEALGGMRSNLAPELFDSPYDLARRLDSIQGVPVPIRSTKSFVARYQRHFPDALRHQLQADPASLDERLIGSVTSQLNVELEDCWLFHGRWVYPLGRLRQGVQTPLPEIRDPQVIKSYLTQREGLPEQYSVHGLQVDRVMEMMMFHEAAGGTDYTRLQNRYQSYVDLSQQLASGRAIIVGRTRKPVVQLSHEEQPLSADQGAQWTYYRFVFSPGEE